MGRVEGRRIWIKRARGVGCEGGRCEGRGRRTDCKQNFYKLTDSLRTLNGDTCLITVTWRQKSRGE